MFAHDAVLPQVYGGIRVALAVRLQRDGDGVRPTRVDEVGEGQDSLVANASIALQVHDPRQVGALVPELGAVAQLVQQETHRLSGLQLRPRNGHTEPSVGQVAGEDAGVVAITLDGAGVARNTVLLQSGRALADGTREKDAGD